VIAISLTGATEITKTSIAQTNDDYEIIVAKQEEKKEVEKPKQEVKETTKKEEYPKFVSRGLPRSSVADGSFKSFMSYKMISSRASKQWEFQQNCFTDENGMRRYVENDIEFYVGALGSFYGSTIGTKYRVTLSHKGEESTFYLILGDCKDDKHTDPTHKYMEANGNIIEFIVNQRKLSDLVLRMGDVSYASKDLKGSIVKIEEIIED
jgi:hypothetical protein